MLREKALHLRATTTELYRQESSQVICQKLWDLICKNKYQTIHTYLPFRDEVNIHPFIQKAYTQGLTVVTPKTLKNRMLKNIVFAGYDNLEEGKFGTLHPMGELEYEGTYDVILVPGLAFSKEGKRLGFGAGYYDNFLSQHKNARKIGIAYSVQLFEDIPTEAHDIQLNQIITE